jgi:hypothetical protein
MAWQGIDVGPALDRVRAFTLLPLGRGHRFPIGAGREAPPACRQGWSGLNPDRTPPILIIHMFRTIDPRRKF